MRTKPTLPKAESMRPLDCISGDRRVDRRYALALDLRWTVRMRRKAVRSGTGTTLDLSSGGILFHAGESLLPGAKVELSISWPVLLHGIAPMCLMASGTIVRAAEGRAAVRTTEREFRAIAVGADQCAVVARQSSSPHVALVAAN